MLQEVFKECDESLLIIFLLVIILFLNDGCGLFDGGCDNILLFLFLILLLTGGIC